VGEDVVGQVKRLQRALGINPSIEGPETAPAIRLGAVDDVAATERLDERGPKRRPESSSRERDRGPRNFERREPRERTASSRHESRSNDGDARPSRGFERRESQSARGESAGRGFERRERAPRDDSAGRGFERRERAPRGESTGRGFERREETPQHFESAGHGRGSEGVVAFFNDSKGFGFASDDKGDDLFIHFSSIVGDGFKSLSQGQKITFEEAQGPKGREAKNVRVVSAGRSRR